MSRSASWRLCARIIVHANSVPYKFRLGSASGDGDNAQLLEAVHPILRPKNVDRDGLENNDVAGFGAADSADLVDLGLSGIDAKVAFSPHAKDNALLKKAADDSAATKSSLFYSLAFLSETPGVTRDAIKKVTKDKNRFVYGMADKEVGGLDLHLPDGNVAPVFPAQLSGNLPEPFKSEPTGGGGVRMHYKFVVIDFDKPTARVYMGSYNFSVTADTKNGENLLVIRDRRVAVSYVVEALSLFDHYHFRVVQKEA